MLTVPPVRGDAVVITGGPLMMSEKAALAVNPFASVTWILKLAAPLAAGIPLITPVAPASDKPAGNAPVLTTQVYGGVPPPAVTVCE
jgi:hypothetical protein